MKFCPKCGRQRTGSNRFCSGCGNDFGESAVGGGTPLAAEPVTRVPLAAAVPLAAEATNLEPIPAAAEPVAPESAEQTRWDRPLDAARWDPQVDAAHVEPAAPAPPPGPYGSWYTEPSPGDEATRQRDEPADRWKTADTVYATPSPATGYLPPAPPGPAFLPPSAPVDPVGPRRRSGRTAAFIIVGVLVALAAGGGVYALVSRSHGHTTAQPGHSAVPVSASTGAPAVQASASPTASASALPSTSPSASAPPSLPQTGTVQVAASVASNPAEPQVAAYLNRYFNAINTRNYSEYNSLLDPQEQQSDSKSSFDSGYATTKDSDEVLTGITDTGGGSLTANVAFTSHQSPSDSVDQSACNNWQLSFYLVPQGNGYVMKTTPADYKAAYTDC
jgi:hypothetical protein